MTIRTGEQTVTTFTPLSRGRLRCNQTGEIVKQGRTHAYRVMRSNDPKGVSRESLEDLEEARRLKRLKDAPPM